MGLNSRGAAYKTFKVRCEKLELDLSHFVSDKHLRKTLSKTEISRSIIDNISRQMSLKQLQLNPHTGANIKWIDRKAREYLIDTSHWKGQGHLKGKKHNWTPGISLDQILVKNSTYLWTANLKKKLLKDGYFDYRCSECGISEWNNKPLSLQLDHINGVNDDNRIENLRLLCPNCHSQTTTFAAKNKRTVSAIFIT